MIKSEENSQDYGQNPNFTNNHYKRIQNDSLFKQQKDYKTINQNMIQQNTVHNNTVQPHPTDQLQVNQLDRTDKNTKDITNDKQEQKSDLKI